MEITSCCGICSLKAGTIIVGILNLVFGTLSLITGCLLFWSGYSYYYPIEVKSVLSGVIIYSLMVLTMDLLLIIGAVKRNINYVFPFVYSNFGIFFLFLGSCIIIIVKVCSIPGVAGVLIFVVFFATGVGLSLYIYLWLITYFFYKELFAEQIESNTFPKNNRLDLDRSPLKFA